MKRLIFVRHGQTASNASKILQGWDCPGLDDVGHEQALRVAEALKDEKVDFIYVSDITRAKQTAEKICNKIGKDFICDERLREINVGSNAGRSYKDVDEEKESLMVSKFEYRHNDGECWADVVKRTKDFFDEIFEKHNGKSVMIISHGGVGRSLLSSIFGKHVSESDEYRHDNTGVSILENDGNGWKIVKLNSTEHLASRQTPDSEVLEP